ncbi:MAG TPA: hypothetical protein VFV22_01825 [Candidatus Paceibacterota bacterium]|nr:hypothetical protein [Candidatus Paceibacterota bacterium]
MLFWGKKHDDAQYGALIDISSGSIGIAILLSDPQKPLPRIVYTERIPFRQTAHYTMSDILDTRRVREALLSASLMLSSDGLNALRHIDEHAEISKIFITCSSPWALTIARSAQYNNDTDFKINKSIITDLVNSVERDILEHVAVTHDEHKTYQIVERATVDTTINGYAVSSPFGLTGKTLSLSHVVGIIPQELLDAAEEAHEKIFPKAIMNAHTTMLVTYCILRDIFPNVHTACIIDITGEATEFGFVERNLLIDNSYVPWGINTTLRAVSRARGNPISDLERQFSEYTSTTCSDETPLGSAVAEYRKNIVDALEAMQEQHVLPKNFILITPPHFYNACQTIISDTLSEMNFSNFTIHTVTEETMRAVMPGTTPDPYLALGARFFHKLHGCTDINDPE